MRSLSLSPPLSSHLVGNSQDRKRTAASSPSRIEWPLIVLRGNGQLFVVLIGIDTERPSVQGPLTIRPATADNYGCDYCAVLVLPSQPPTVVMAETNGNLHHGLLLEATDEETGGGDGWGADDSGLSAAEWSVHVLETVQLELGLSGAGETSSNSCPVFLKRDVCNEARYFAYHETGLHACTVEYIAELAYFADDRNDGQTPAGDLLSRASHAEYVICTQALPSARPNAVLGFALLTAPAGMLVFLASGQVVSLNLIADSSTLRDLLGAAARRTENDGSRGKQQPPTAPPSFELHIKSLLQSTVTQPLLQLGRSASTEPSAKETLELLMHATNLLREQYFAKHDRCRQELEKRVRLLQLMHQQQRSDLAQLQHDMERVRNTAERLAERYEDAQERQLDAFRRAQEVARLVTAANPQSAAAETEFKQQIERIAGAAKRLTGSIAAARRRIEDQERQGQQFDGAQRQRAKTIVLQPRMEATIRGLMTEL